MIKDNIKDIDFNFIVRYLEQYPLFSYKKNMANTDKDIVYFKESNAGANFNNFECCKKFASLSEDQQIRRIKEILMLADDPSRNCLDIGMKFIPEFTKMFIDPLYNSIQKEITNAQNDLRKTYQSNSLNLSEHLNKEVNDLIHNRCIPQQDFVQPSIKLKNLADLDQEKNEFQSDIGKVRSLIKNFLNIIMTLENLCCSV